MYARYTPRGIPVSSAASPRPLFGAIGLVDVDRFIYIEYLDFWEFWSILIYDICGKGKRSFPIKFLVELFLKSSRVWAEPKRKVGCRGETPQRKGRYKWIRDTPTRIF